MAIRPGGGQRLGREQLDQLAAELRDQLDQEYTSLMSSIDEVQALMEAEVAGVELLPPLEELEAFARKAEAVVASLGRQAAEAREVLVSKKIEPEIPLPSKKQSKQLVMSVCSSADTAVPGGSTGRDEVQLAGATDTVLPCSSNTTLSEPVTPRVVHTTESVSNITSMGTPRVLQSPKDSVLAAALELGDVLQEMEEHPCLAQAPQAESTSQAAAPVESEPMSGGSASSSSSSL